MSASVPFVDLGIQRDRIAHEVAAGFERVLRDTSFIQGPDVAAFEREYADYCGVEHCVGVANGTDALELALLASGIGVGDEVILPTNTFVATAEAVSRVGADLVLVDCDERFLIDPDAVAAAVTPRTRAVLAVHLYGQLADMGALRAAVDTDVLVIEDAAQSQGARADGGASGALGDIAATSFYPGKNLGAYGDAGAVTTRSEELAHAVRQLGNHGGIRKYEHLVVGTNSRLDTLQAVVLRAKLARLDDWNQERREAVMLYDTLLAELPEVARPLGVGEASHVWHLYVVRVPDRDSVLASLNAAGVGAGVHYPMPIHLLPAFENLGRPAGSYPRAEAAAREIVSLPVFPGITPVQIELVVNQMEVALTSLRRVASPLGGSR